MGLLANKLGIRAFSIEDPSQPLLPYSALVEQLGIGKSDAGLMVSEATAMRLTTAFACIMVISSDLSSLKRAIYQKLPDGSVREAPEHPLWKLICENPSPTMTGVTYRGAELVSVLGWGNAYTLVRRDRGNRAASLQILPASKTAPVMIEGKLMYATTATVDGVPAYAEPKDILHPMGFSLNGVVGLSPVQQCKNAFGLALAAERFGAQFFGNGARSTGVLTHPDLLDVEARANLTRSLAEMVTGNNALRPILLEEGMKWEQVSIAPNDAQFIETRKFQRSEICSLYRVPLHLIQDLDRSTNNNIEHQSLDYIRYTLRPWAVRIEEEINSKLLGNGFFVEHDFNDFQRGDFASQTTGIATLRSAGVFSINDGLRTLRMNTIPAEDGGDERTVPLNVINARALVDGNGPDEGDSDGAGAGPDVPAEPFTDLRRERIVSSYRRLFRDAVGRTVNRRNADAQFAYKAFQPVLAAMAQVLLTMYVASVQELSAEDEGKVNQYARELAAKAPEWTAKNASETATRLTGEAYKALKTALIG
jgi:HK97 family phage portal protein